MLKMYYSYHVTFGMNLKLMYDEVIIKDNGIVEIICNKHYCNPSSVRELADSPYAYELAVYDENGELQNGFAKATFEDIIEDVDGWHNHNKVIFKVEK